MSWSPAFISLLPDLECKVTTFLPPQILKDGNLELWAKINSLLSSVAFVRVLYHRNRKIIKAHSISLNCVIHLGLNREEKAS